MGNTAKMLLLDKNALTLNNAHPNKTVFILGNGPQLSKINKCQFTCLSDKITIGVNNIYEFFSPTYYFTGYTFYAALANKFYSHLSLKIIQMVDSHMVDITVPNVIRVHKMLFHGTLNRFIDESSPYICTCNNVIFGAMHLAFILGASKIIFVGVEQRNGLHAIDFNTKKYEKRIAMYKKTALEYIRYPAFQAEADYVMNFAIENSKLSQKMLSEQPMLVRTAAFSFAPANHYDTFFNYLTILQQHKIELYSTAYDSILSDVGIDYMALDDALIKY